MKVNKTAYTYPQTLKSKSLKENETGGLPEDAVSSKIPDDIGLQQKALKDMKNSNDSRRLKGCFEGVKLGLGEGLLVDFISVGVPLFSPMLWGYLCTETAMGALIGAAVLPVGMALAGGLTGLINPGKIDELKKELCPTLPASETHGDSKEKGM
ncbi:MAG: hypothetical protein KKA19_03035 [Candidatus Margulisbacteria bacterium]|nr:hypothetical protein [Candidatus Margulisiibacteriota bacterium]